jgi:hypothetical protein
MNRLDQISFLHNAIERESIKKELVLILDNQERKSLLVFYKTYNFPNEDIFNLYFTDENSFLKYRKYFKKGNKCIITLTELNFNISGGELKEFDGKKELIDSIIIDIRRNFLKLKII